MQIARFPRRRYTAGRTPLERLDRLTEHLGGPELYIKRDDLLGLAGGGNKTRKLEFLVAEALAQGADTLITAGAVQSNHCRLTLAAAVREGLRCRLVLEQRVPGSYDPDASGNNFLFRLLGVEEIRVVDGGADLDGEMEAVAADLERVGRKGYVIPGGGSTPLGALGYVACAEEMLGQAFESGVAFDHVVCASGSGGTHAGLVAGMVGMNAGIPVIGVSVRHGRTEQAARIHALASDVLALLGIEGDVPRDAVTVFDEYVGPGYSLPTPEMVAAVRTLATEEAILLDPVYTGKAMAGLLGLVREGRFGKGERVVFIHTGGSPALYAYAPLLLDGNGRGPG